MKRWKKTILSCFVIGIVWSFGSHCCADGEQGADKVERIGVLEDRIKEELKKGSSSFTIYINKEIEAGELQEINGRLDGFYGYVDRYSQWKVPLAAYYKTVFYLNNSDNYYVLAHLLEDKPLGRELEKARELADKAEQIQSSIFTEGMSDYEKLVAIHDYLIENSAYDEEAEKEKDADEYSSYGVLINHRGVCSGYSQAFQLFMELNDIEGQIVLGTADGVKHSWNLVCLEDEWYHVDATWDDPVPDEKGRRIYAYFNVSDEYMETTHQWERDRYPKAEGTKYNYYVQNDSVIKNQKDFVDYARQELKNGEPKITCLIKGYKEEDYKSSLFRKVMAGTKVVSLNLQMFGEGEDKVLLLIPDYGRR